MSRLNIEKIICCVWPGIALPLGKDGGYLVKYFKENYDINIQYLEGTKTLAGNGAKGSRIDQIFNIKEDSMDQFDDVKSKIGVLTAKEIVQNGDHRIYKELVYRRYFKQFEDELLKTGELSKADAYQTKA